MMRQVNNPQLFNIIYNVATLTHCRVYNKNNVIRSQLISI
ncbi:hypothetical protein CSC25_3751 [Klebsiella pneumoniae]|nr:hypothetical protein CSC25_3751 [Klebsiella pneumoniae]